MRNPVTASRFSEDLRRTQFAEERTLLAWWRTGIATAGVALAVGGVLPKLSDVARDRAVALGAGYAVLALSFVVGGSLRAHFSRKASRSGFSSKVPAWTVALITIYSSGLIVLTAFALL